MKDKWELGETEPLTLGDYKAVEEEELIVTLAVPLMKNGTVVAWIDATPIDDPEVYAQAEEILSLVS